MTTKASRLLPLLLALAAGSVAAAQDAPRTTPSNQRAQQAAAAPATSQDAPVAGTTLAQGKFDLLDGNHDGYVDRNEAGASSVLATQFERFDRDHDGKLSLAEFSAINDLAAIKLDRKGY